VLLLPFLLDGVFYNRASFYRHPGFCEKIFDQQRAVHAALCGPMPMPRDTRRRRIVSALRLEQRLDTTYEDSKRRRTSRRSTEDVIGS
jgi:hypothetical protein